MLRSLANSASGLRALQSALDQTADNIANVNTAGYKRSEVSFHDLLYRRLRDRRLAVAPPPGVVEPEGGSGTRVSSVTTDFTQGPLTQSSRSLDLAIEGEGFFRVIMPDGGYAYTRDGAFYLDEQGNIATARGFQLELPAQVNGMDPQQLVFAPGGQIYQQLPDGPVYLGDLVLYRFVNNDGLYDAGSNLYLESPASGPPVAGVPGNEGFGVVRQHSLEYANVNLAAEFVNLIVTQRALQSNVRALTTSDELWFVTLQVRG